MPVAIIASIYAAFYWAHADLSHHGAQSITMRAFIVLGKVAWYTSLPFVWLLLAPAQVVLSKIVKTQ